MQFEKGKSEIKLFKDIKDGIHRIGRVLKKNKNIVMDNNLVNKS